MVDHDDDEITEKRGQRKIEDAVEMGAGQKPQLKQHNGNEEYPSGKQPLDEEWGIL
jgi:hypothetical protein